MDESSVIKQKIFVLDTNVIINNPHAIVDGDFEDNCVVIPMVVIEELDHLKESASVSMSAREAIKVIERLVPPNQNFDVVEPIQLSNGGELVLFRRLRSEEFDGNEQTSDNEILATALLFRKNNPPAIKVIVISDDTAVLLKARFFGLDAGRYAPSYVERSGVLDDTESINLTETECQELFEKKICVLDKEYNPNRVYGIHCAGEKRSDGKERSPIEYFMESDRKTLVPINLNNPRNIMGVKIADRRQEAAWNVLNKTELELIALIGSAGTGKTILSLAAGIKQVLAGQYEQVIVSRPPVPVRDKDRLGFLPGTMEEKMDPWLEPIWDNLHFLLQNYREQLSKKESDALEAYVGGKRIDNLPRQEMLDIFRSKFPIEVVCIQLLRGRTLRDSFVIIDECQNTDKEEIKMIVSRAGQKTKMVLTGDVTQVDIHPYGGKSANGLSLTAAAFAEEPSASIIHLKKVYRSRLAELAGNLL